MKHNWRHWINGWKELIWKKIMADFSKINWLDPWHEIIETYRPLNCRLTAHYRSAAKPTAKFQVVEKPTLNDKSELINLTQFFGWVMNNVIFAWLLFYYIINYLEYMGQVNLFYCILSLLSFISILGTTFIQCRQLCFI